ncbi:MAG: hypothetical protein MI810_06660, partial [Flavobacteriales bacterium]|nr:hypothetical protein [Flavobacteriales bacterium]
MRLLLTFFLFLIAHGLLATDHEDHLARLKPRGYITELGISPSGEIWMASKAGQVYYTKEFGDLWHIGPFGSLDPSNFSSGKTFERINFLSEEVAILSGFIQENGRQNFVYRSEDGGKSWEKVVFGKSSWIDAAYFTEDGKGWMSGSSQLIYYTQDYGESWVSKDKVEKKGNLRFSTIHFSKDQKVGLFGSFWNKVYRTKDNCENWEDIETPLQQKKYTKISAKKRPDIRKIRILGDHYLINQEGRIFYSKADEIDWVRLPSIIDFEVSDDYAYFITNDLKVQLINEQLKEIWTSENTLINSPKAVKVIDSTLYAFTGDKIYRIAPNNFESSTLFTSDIPIPEPYNKLSFKGKEYGFSGLDILQFKDNRWIRIAESPFETAHSTVFQKKIIIANPSLDKRLEVNPKTGEFIPFELPKEIIPPTLSLKSITFSSGSSGCFHFDDHTRVYELKGE